MPAHYTLILGTHSWSSWSLRPFMAMTATGQPFETVIVRLRQPETRDEILRHSPSGKLPVLKIAEAGQIVTVWDSLAICETLAERHPEAGLLPDDPTTRATARAYAAEMHAGFPDLRDQLNLDFARQLPLPELRAQTIAQIARIIACWEQALALHEKAGGFLFGRFCIADCMYAPVVSRFRTYEIALPERAAAYAARVWALPGMQAWHKGAEREIADGIA